MLNLIKVVISDIRYHISKAQLVDDTNTFNLHKVQCQLHLSTKAHSISRGIVFIDIFYFVSRDKRSLLYLCFWINLITSWNKTPEAVLCRSHWFWPIRFDLLEQLKSNRIVRCQNILIISRHLWVHYVCCCVTVFSGTVYCRTQGFHNTRWARWQ